MLRYGSDQPGHALRARARRPRRRRSRAREFKVFAGVLASGGVVRGLNAGAREVPRSELDALTEHVKRYGAGGLVWAFVQEDGSWRSPTAKFLTDEQRGAVTRKLGRPAGRPAADRRRQAAHVAATALGELRLELARRFDLVPAGPPRRALGRRLPDVRVERGRGALERAAPSVHRADRLVRRPGRAALARLRHRARRRRRSAAARSVSTGPRSSSRSSTRSGSPRRRRDARFGFLLDALRYGAPPHGGLALGIDRIVAILAGPRLDPRRDRVPQDGERLGPADRRARRRSTRAARRARAQGHRAAAQP